jgi:hypothetical protein
MRERTVIVGGGAAGLMAAATLAREAAWAEAGPVLVLERGAEPGRKILVSGGGRCNLTHQAAPDEFLAAFPHGAARFLRPAVFDLSPMALRDWLAARGLRSVVEPDGCVFPAGNHSRDVLKVLLAALRGSSVELQTEVECRAVRAAAGRVVGVETTAGTIPASRVILAAGGPAWPQAGGTHSGLDILAALGHTIVPPRPGLAPLYTEPNWMQRLEGVSLTRVELMLENAPGRRKRSASGPVVFTRFGLSGPAALDLSLLVEKFPAAVALALVPGKSAAEVEAELAQAAAERGQRRIDTHLAELLPRSVVREALAALGIPAETRLAQLRSSWRRDLAALLAAARLRVARLGGWTEAMLAVGGCTLDEINPKTMESRLVRGLHVVGELLDIAGPTGGYNLHAAFATGRLAARAVARGSVPRT